MQLLDLDVARDYYGVLLVGLAVTVGLTLVVIVLSAMLAIPVALARLSHNRLVRTPIDIYVEVIRATPLLLQLIYIYYVLPSVDIRLPPITTAVVGLTLNYTAYMSEVYRGGIQSVAKGQWLAAEALGMTDGLAFRRIILPQAVRIVIPSLGNYFISLFKDTALCSVVGVQELMFKGRIISARSFQYFTIYTLTGIFYFSVGYPAAIFVRWLERMSQRGWSRKRHRP
jgi:polar amino acid transport system permease protein